jgi:predicted PurR-regulated permease PerM
MIGQMRFSRMVFSLLALGVAIIFVVQVWNVLLPFLFGLIIAYLIHPLVDRFVARGLRRDRTVVVLYIFFLGLAVALGVLLLPDLIREADSALKGVRTYTSTFNSMIDQFNIEGRQFLRHIIGRRADAFAIPFRADQFMESLLTKLPENILNVVHAGLWIFIIPFVSFFALAQGRHWIDLLFEWTPSEYVESLLGMMAEVNATLGGYIRGQLLDAMCVGSLTIAGLWVLGINGAVLLGTLTGLFNVIPYMAPIVGGSLALLTGYFQGASASALYGIVLLYLGVRLLDDFIFLPFVVGSSVSLHPVLILFAILAGVHVGGFLGLVFAVPAAAVIKVVMSIVLRNRRERILLGDHVMS